MADMAAGDEGYEGEKTFLEALGPVCLVTGRYGVGKTSFSLNLAVDLARLSYDVTLVDLDIVNPYFRAAEYRADLESAGVKVAAPVYSEAGSSLDIPAMTVALEPLVREAYDSPERKRVVIDVGGDDAGSRVLGRFASAIAEGPYTMLHLVNVYRSLDGDIGETVEAMHEIEAASRLSVTGLVSNAHMKDETAFRHIEEGYAFARAVSRASETELLCVTAPDSLARREKRVLRGIVAQAVLYPVSRGVTTPWERHTP